MKRFDSTQHLIKHLKDARRCIDHMILYLQVHKHLDVRWDDTDNERLSFYNDARFIDNLMLVIQKEIKTADAATFDQLIQEHTQSVIQKYGDNQQ